MDVMKGVAMKGVVVGNQPIKNAATALIRALLRIFYFSFCFLFLFSSQMGFLAIFQFFNFFMLSGRKKREKEEKKGRKEERKEGKKRRKEGKKRRKERKARKREGRRKKENRKRKRRREKTGGRTRHL
jgi:hypothetical protein